MLLTGLVGGLLNYLRTRTDDAQSANLWQSVLGGVIAAFLVPLFLNMISSSLLDAIRGTGSDAADPSKLFIFAGFCLLAAVSSRSFIATLSDRLLKETKAARQEIKQIKREVEPIVEKETEKEPGEGRPLSASEPGGTLGEDARKVLKALASGRFTLRTRTGITQETGIEKDLVDKTLGELVKMGLARKVQVMVNGQVKNRWHISAKGRASF